MDLGTQGDYKLRDDLNRTYRNETPIVIGNRVGVIEEVLPSTLFCKMLNLFGVEIVRVKVKLDET